MNTDRWYYRVFQSAPDLIRALLPGSEAGLSSELSLDPAAPSDRLYRFEALEIKELSHRLDGVLWPRESTGCAETGSPEYPVVLLEVQMHPDPGFHHRLAAQTYRFLQQQPQLEHWAVPGAAGGVAEPGRASGRAQLDPLLTLPVRPESELAPCSQQILARRPDLDGVVIPMLMQRFPELSREEIMVIAGIPHEELRHTRAAQEWLAEGRQEGEAKGRQEEAASMALRLLNRRCGPLSEATTAQIQALPLEQLECLADALLDFAGPADLATWLATNL